jgi:hypothetical protein
MKYSFYINFNFSSVLALGKKIIIELSYQNIYESPLKVSFLKLYVRYNDLVCNYKSSLVHLLNNLFQTVISILRLMTGNLIYMYEISPKGARRV